MSGSASAPVRSAPTRSLEASRACSYTMRTPGPFRSFAPAPNTERYHVLQLFLWSTSVLLASNDTKTVYQQLSQRLPARRPHLSFPLWTRPPVPHLFSCPPVTCQWSPFHLSPFHLSTVTFPPVTFPPVTCHPSTCQLSPDHPPSCLSPDNVLLSSWCVYRKQLGGHSARQTPKRRPPHTQLG